MTVSGHVYASTKAPATTLILSLEYSAAVDIYTVLQGRGVVEANAEFAAILEPDEAVPGTLRMANATPEYLQSLTDDLQATLNDVALADVSEFIDAMSEAGTPEEIGAVAWGQIQEVYDNVNSPSPQADQLSCIVVDVGTPGSEPPPPDPDQ